jgi:hypothetical protein
MAKSTGWVKVFDPPKIPARSVRARIAQFTEADLVAYNKMSDDDKKLKLWGGRRPMTEQELSKKVAVKNFRDMTQAERLDHLDAWHAVKSIAIGETDHPSLNEINKKHREMHGKTELKATRNHSHRTSTKESK